MPKVPCGRASSSERSGFPAGLNSEARMWSLAVSNVQNALSGCDEIAGYIAVLINVFPKLGGA
jgi:hypothetical protein